MSKETKWLQEKRGILVHAIEQEKGNYCLVITIEGGAAHTSLIPYANLPHNDCEISIAKLTPTEMLELGNLIQE